MKKMFNKKFFLIFGSTITLLIVLSVAMIFLTKENTKTFTKEGYIIASGKEEASVKYYFDEGTSYKKNISSELVFKDTSGEKVTVETDNFMHYTDGGIKFLKNGVIMDLDSVNLATVPYYNITDKSTLEYTKQSYFIETIDKTLAFNNLAGRISDNKYIFAGVDIKLQLAGNDNIIDGDYFEVQFIEDGIIKVENQEVSYQTTAENSYILVGDNTKIDLGSKKIYYNDEEKMSLSQMTIDGNENIEIVPEEEEKEDNPSGSGEGGGNGSSGGTGTNDGNGEPNDNPGNAEDNQGNNDITDNENQNPDENGTENESDEPNLPNEGEGNEQPDNNDKEEDGTGSGTGNKTQRSASIELIKAEVGAASIKASFSVNDPDNTIKGDLVVHITNTDTGKRVYSTVLDKLQPQEINVIALSPDSNYVLSINEETNGEYDTQYFQKLFKTDTLGIKLEKTYVTQDSLEYQVVFSEESQVKSATVTLYDEKYKQIGDPIVVTKEDPDAYFGQLVYNTSYNIVLDTIIMDNLIYEDTYKITKTTKTLKRTPYLDGLSVVVNNEENKVKSFTLGVNNINDPTADPDKSITQLTYYIYEEDSLTPDNLNTVQPVTYFTKKDKDKIDIPIDGSVIKSKTNYVYKVVAEYYDNEKYGEFETAFSEKFLLSGETTIVFEKDEKNTTFNQIAGAIILNDDTCTVPMEGRPCNSKANNFELKYRKINSGEAWQTLKIENFNPKTLKANIKIEGLTANTQYEFQLFATIEKYGEIPKVDRVGSFEEKTDNLEDALVVSNWTQNKSTRENLINVSATITSSNDDQDFSESIKTITFNLYSGNRSDALENGLSITPMKSVTLREEIAGDFIKYYNKPFVIDSLETFGITDQEVITEVVDEETGEVTEVVEIIPAIEILKELTNSRNPELKDQYTIEITGITDGTNDIRIVDNYYVFNVPPVFLIEDKIELPSIEVTPYKNSQITELTEIKDFLGISNRYANLGDTDIIGFRLNTYVQNINIDAWLKEISDIFGLNRVKELIYYVCDADENADCTVEDAVAEKRIDLTATSDLLTAIKVERGTNGEKGKIKRGRTYIFKLKFYIDTDGVDGADTYYPSIDVKTPKIDVPRTSPVYQTYILDTDNNAVNYKIEIFDFDGALDDKNLYYSIDKGVNKEPTPPIEENPEEELPEEDIPTEEEQEPEIPTEPETSLIEGELELKDCKDEVYDDTDKRKERVCNFTLDSLEADSVYSLSLKVASIRQKYKKQLVGKYIFDGKYVYDQNTVRYALVTNEHDNKLKIKISDDKNSKYINRISTYILTLSAEGVDDKTIVYTSDKVNTCEDGENSYSCLIVDYADITEFKTKQISIKLNAYYDSGVINNDFANIDFSNPGETVKISNIGYILQVNNDYKNKFEYGGYIQFNKNGDILTSSNGNLTTSSRPIGYYTYAGNNKTQIQLIRGTSLNGYDFATEEEKEAIIQKRLIYTADKIAITYYTDKNNNQKNTSVNNKLLSEVNLNTENTNSFKFNSIIPKIKIVDITRSSKRKLDGATITINTTGFNVDEFKEEDGKYYYYVNVYKDEEKQEFIKDYKLEIDSTNGSAETTLTKYMPGTTYYFDVSAYLKKSNGDYEKTLLFDDATSNDYVVKTYSFTTFITEGENPNDKIFYSDTPPALNYTSTTNVDKLTGDNYLKRELKFYQRTANNIGEYQMRIELLDINGNVIIEKTLAPYTDPKNGSTTLEFTQDITPTKEEIANNGIGGYVFGEGYYTLKLTTITTATNFETGEDQTVEKLIYEEPAALENSAPGAPIYKIKKPVFTIEREASLTSNTLIFTVKVKDDDFALAANTQKNNKAGEYCAALYDPSDNLIREECGNSSFSDKQFKYENLYAGTEYKFRIYANYYANNIDIDKKYDEIIENVYLSTVKYNETAAGNASSTIDRSKNEILLTFGSAVNLQKIKKYSYNLYKSDADGKYGDPVASESNLSAQFKYYPKDYSYELLITDFKDSNGNDYKIEKNANYRLVMTYYFEDGNPLPFDDTSNAYTYYMRSGA